jgi:AAA15 family ATPase/GTPase
VSIVKASCKDSTSITVSQLIFTSHETALLNLNLLRRDEINFVYKNEDTCSTFIRSLKEFHARKGENIEKAYLAGRYLTSPEVKENLLAGAADEE